MKVTKKKSGEANVVLDVVATAEEVANALHSAQVAFADSMGLQPEQGKTVAQVAEEKMGIKNLDSMVEANAIDELVPLALDKKNLAPAYPPKAHPKSAFRRGEQFSFSLDVALKPDYELTSYDPVEITLAPFKSDTEAAIDEQIAELTKNYTAYVADDPRPIEKGDSCMIALKCYEDGQELKGLTSDGRTYTAGMGFMPEGFEEQVLGMTPGETKHFVFDGPGLDDEGNEVMKPIDCTLTVKEIQKAVPPTVDDAWIRANMPMYKSVADLRQAIGRSVEHQEREAYEEYKRQAVAAELGRRFQGSIADEVYESTSKNYVENLRGQLQQQGKTWQEFLEENGGEQQFNMMLMMQVREMLVQGYALDAVFRHEHLTLTDHDIEATCRSINPKVHPKQLRQQFEQAGRGFALRESAERMKANQYVADRAIVTLSEE